ncbi:hypothetical protein BU15DRAFT_77522 [Melanogaster broomeanus]|nr:hypothetical protein BU15DRAFT_77522 [Melanogaster broomeanus]
MSPDGEPVACERKGMIAGKDVEEGVLEAERQKQGDLRRQIKLLQAQLADVPDDDAPLRSPKRKQSESTLLAPATPSPKKKRRTDSHGCKPPAAGGPSRSQGQSVPGPTKPGAQLETTKLSHPT